MVLKLNKEKGELIVQKRKSVREGWDDAFAQYAKEGEDKQLLPDFLDAEADML